MYFIYFLIILVVNIPRYEGVTAPKIIMNDGREIPSFALGTWLGNSTEGRITPGSDEVENAVVWALEAGYRHVDTAYAYKIEDQVGRVLLKKIDEGLKREDIFVTTKLWNEFHARDSVIPALRKSLSNLGLDYVDLYLIHWPVGQFANQSYDSTDYLETWRGMTEAKSLGLAKSIGLSNFNESQINRILQNGLEKPAVLQVEVELNVIPIPKSLTKSRVKENIGIFDFHLTDEERTLLRSYDKDYRYLPQTKWREHTYYPF